MVPQIHYTLSDSLQQARTQRTESRVPTPLISKPTI